MEQPTATPGLVNFDLEKYNDLKKKWPKDLPITKNLIMIMKHTHPSPEIEMKMTCYLTSMITSFVKAKSREEDGELSFDDYDEYGINRFVTAMLDRQTECVSVLSHKDFFTALTAKKKLTYENYKSFYSKIAAAEIDGVNVPNDEKSYVSFKNKLKAFRNCLIYSVGHRTIDWEKDTSSENINNLVKGFGDELITKFDEIMTPIFSSVAKNRVRKDKSVGITKYNGAEQTIFNILNADLALCRKDCRKDHAFTANNDKTTLIICHADCKFDAFKLDDQYTNLLKETKILEQTDLTAIFDNIENGKSDFHYWARYAEFLRQNGGGDVLTMSHARHDGLTLTDMETTYNNNTSTDMQTTNSKLRHCSGNANQGRLMISLHTQYSQFKRFTSIYVEHPKNSGDKSLQTILGTTFFKNTVIQFLNSDMLVTDGKIYLPFHPYILKQLYHFNDKECYKMTFQDGETNVLQKSDKKWKTAFKEKTTNDGKPISISSACNYDPKKEDFLKAFPVDEKVNNGKKESIYVNQQHLYYRHWHTMPEDDFKKLRWIVLSPIEECLRNYDPKKIYRLALDKDITEEMIGCKHPYTDETKNGKTTPTTPETPKTKRKCRNAKANKSTPKPTPSRPTRNNRFHPKGTLVRQLFGDEYKVGEVVGINEEDKTYKIRYSNQTTGELTKEELNKYFVYPDGDVKKSVKQKNVNVVTPAVEEVDSEEKGSEDSAGSSDAETIFEEYKPSDYLVSGNYRGDTEAEKNYTMKPRTVDKFELEKRVLTVKKMENGVMVVEGLEDFLQVLIEEEINDPRAFCFQVGTNGKNTLFPFISVGPYWDDYLLLTE